MVVLEEIACFFGVARTEVMIRVVGESVGFCFGRCSKFVAGRVLYLGVVVL